MTKQMRQFTAMTSFLLVLFISFVSAQYKKNGIPVYTKLEDALENPDAVEVLNLSKQKLTDLSVNILKLRNLKELYLFRNELDQFPAGIAELKKLEVLNMSLNRIKEVPPEIKNLTNLESLYLNNNHLVQLPPEIGKLSSLKRLDLIGNELAALPEAIGNLKNLEILMLHSNKLVSLPPSVKKLKKLRVIDLRENMFSREERDTLQKMLPKCALLFDEDSLGDIADSIENSQ